MSANRKSPDASTPTVTTRRSPSRERAWKRSTPGCRILRTPCRRTRTPRKAVRLECPPRGKRPAAGIRLANGCARYGARRLRPVRRLNVPRGARHICRSACRNDPYGLGVSPGCFIFLRVKSTWRPLCHKCPERDSNPHGDCSPGDFKSPRSTGSIIRATPSRALGTLDRR